MLYGTLLEHMKQQHKLAQTAELGQPLAQDRAKPLLEAEVLKLSKHALATTCEFHSMLVVDRTPEQTFQDMRSWWQSEGVTFFRAESSKQDAVDDEADVLEPDCVEVEDRRDVLRFLRGEEDAAIEDKAGITLEAGVAR